MLEAEAALEAKIAIAMGRLRTLDLADSPESAVAAAYAMLRVMTRDLGESGPEWHQFLREALEESILSVSGR